MNIYARIRKIEDEPLFKRFFNLVEKAEYGGSFQETRDWHDFGIDGYLKKEKAVYAVYCPRYPERTSLQQYKEKISHDSDRLIGSLKKGDVTLVVKKWIFVTPDELPMEVIEHLKRTAESQNWEFESLSAYGLAALFMKHKLLHMDFPEIAAGIEHDKIPSIYVRFVKNRGYSMLELFNNGTEPLQDISLELYRNDSQWISFNHKALYSTDNPVMASTHTCYTLERGERQYIADVPAKITFKYRISAIGVESQKTFVEEKEIIPPPDKT